MSEPQSLWRNLYRGTGFSEKFPGNMPDAYGVSPTLNAPMVLLVIDPLVYLLSNEVL